MGPLKAGHAYPSGAAMPAPSERHAGMPHMPDQGSQGQSWLSKLATVADLILGVVSAIRLAVASAPPCPFLREYGVRLDLEAPALPQKQRMIVSGANNEARAGSGTGGPLCTATAVQPVHRAGKSGVRCQLGHPHLPPSLQQCNILLH